MKNRITKTMRGKAGFTLVELIVVIAILGILAGGGTVGYSGYIKKANMAADQTLVSSVANALQLQAYSDLSGNGTGYVVLSKDGAEADAYGTKAMEAAFGADWANSAKLVYEWPSTSADFLSSMDATTASAVINSSFLTGSTPTELLGEVSDLTNTAFGFVTKKLGDSTLLYDNMKGNFGSSTMSDAEFNAQCEKYGIKVKNVGTDAAPQYAFDNTNQTELATQLSNFMVMAAAEDFAKAATDENHEASVAAGLVLQYATYNAISNSKYADEATKTAYKNMSTTFANANSLQEVQDAMAAFEANSAVAAVKDKYEADPTVPYDDSAAIIDIMTTVGNASDIVTAEDIKNSDLYRSGSVSDYFNSYVAAAELVSGMDEGTLNTLKGFLTDGDVAVYIGGGAVGCTAMDAYRPR